MLPHRLRRSDKGHSILEYVLLLVIFVLSAAAGIETVARVIGEAFSHASARTTIAAGAGKIVGIGKSMPITTSDFHIAVPQAGQKTERNSDRPMRRGQFRHSISFR